MTARIATVSDVRRHGDNLTIVTVQDGDTIHEVVANLQEDGTPRWKAEEVVVYVAEGSLVPDDVLKDRGYWEGDKGLLEGKKGNRVKMRRFAGFESRGLLFKTNRADTSPTHEYALEVRRGADSVRVDVGDDVTEFLGITEHVVQ